MISGCGSGAQGSGGDDSDQNSKGSEALKRKWPDFEDNMKAMKDALVKEDAEKSAKIRRLMQEDAEKSAKIRLLEQTLIRVENTALQPRPMGGPNPFVVFPAEVWEMIIANMDYSSDLEMLCLAYPTLEPFVRKIKKTIFMFENVLPFVCKHLDLKDINNCRLVCGKWNQDVCALLANWNSPNLLPDSLSNHEVTSRTSIPAHKPHYQLKAAYHFKNHEKIQNFMKKMADHLGNPFLGRFLRVTVDDETELPRFWKSILELVKKFGEHVWNLELLCFRQCYNEIDFHKELQQTLNHLPSLKYLTIACYICSKPDKTAMAAEIGTFPLLQLPHLQSLKLGLDGETGLITAFTPYFSSQIHRLKLSKETLENVNFKDEWLRGFINLEHLEVHLKLAEGVSRLLKFPSQNLKKLCLRSSLFADRKLESLTSEQVSSLFENFPRLEYLSLRDFNVAPCSSVKSRMRIGNQQTLEIAVKSVQDDLDFLLGLPSLKHLYLRIGNRSETRVHVDRMDEQFLLKIRKNLYTNTILHSNIWTLLPSLELLELKAMGRKDKYTRAMFENRIG